LTTFATKFFKVYCRISEPRAGTYECLCGDLQCKYFTEVCKVVIEPTLASYGANLGGRAIVV
jgi:hypothetical protein